MTVATTLAESYMGSSAKSAGSAAEAAAVRKASKYSDLSPSYSFQPTAMETLGPINSSAVEVLSEVRRRLTQVSEDPRESKFLFQRLSIILQRYNSIILYQSFATDADPDL